jgi:DNA-binding NtrC family response regulator
MIRALDPIPARRLPSLPAIDPAARSTIRILVVDDERTLRESCATVLEGEGYNVARCGRGTEARDTLERRSFDVALVDWYMGDVGGRELLRAGLTTNPSTLVIVMTGNPSLESSLEALHAGAWDYLPKPFSGTQLQILIGRAAHAVLVARGSRAVEQPAPQPSNDGKITVLGEAPLFRQAVELARRVADTDASVFLTGESGAGKELFARFIHSNSRRSGRSLVALNCAALPEPLLESEMFGHCKGAFTGAVRDKPGLLETANGSTLFLDELIEMPKSIQAKLLRVIQDGVVRRVGSETTDVVVNVRFIAATNTNPEEAMASFRLREDLYYRLRVVPIHVPSLRERPEDIPLLAERFLAHYWGRHRGPTQPLPRLSTHALWALGAHPWPGNVRELQNVIEHAAVLLEPGTEVSPEDIPFIQSRVADPDQVVDQGLEPDDTSYYPARDRVLARFDRRFLTRVILRAGGNLSKAARLAQVDRTTFYRLMERQGLKRDLLTGGTG